MPIESMKLKCSLARTQLENRLRYEPNLIEIQLFEEDFKSPERILDTVRYLKQRGIRVFLHHPMRVKGKSLNIMSEDPEVSSFYRDSCDVLDDICVREDIWCVVHPHYSHPAPRDAVSLLASSIELTEHIESVLQRSHGRFLWENSPSGLFSSANPYWLSHVVRRLGLPLCYDISHSFMSFGGSNERLKNDVQRAFEYTRYYHVVDSQGTDVHDGLPLGHGGIQWEALKPFIQAREFVLEILLSDYEDCSPMVDSALYFEAL